MVLLFMVLLGIAGLKSYRDLTAAGAREKLIENRIDETRTGIERLRGRIERLRSDPASLERLAREDLGLVQARDVVIELPQELAAPAPSHPAPPPPPLRQASPSRERPR